jgi:hypothetical protein
MCCVSYLSSQMLLCETRAMLLSLLLTTKVNGKAIPVTSRGGPQACEMSRIPHFVDSRLTDGGEVVSLTRRPPFTPRKIPRTHFCSSLSRNIFKSDTTLPPGVFVSSPGSSFTRLLRAVPSLRGEEASGTGNEVCWAYSERKVNISLLLVVEAPRVAKGRGSHIS